jgi:hypothetical protein
MVLPILAFDLLPVGFRGVMLVLSVVLFVAVGLVTPPPTPERLLGLVWLPQFRGDGDSSGVAVTEEGPGEVALPWYLDFRGIPTPPSNPIHGCSDVLTAQVSLAMNRV